MNFDDLFQQIRTGKVSDTDLHMLSQQICAAEDLDNLLILISMLEKIGCEHINKIRAGLNCDVLLEKIHAMQDPYNTAILIEILVTIRYIQIYEIFDKLDLQTLSAQISKAPNLQGVIRLIEILHYVGKNKYINQLDPNAISEAICRAIDVYDIIRLLFALKHAKYQQLNDLNPDVFIDQINNAKNIEIAKDLCDTLKEIDYQQYLNILINTIL